MAPLVANRSCISPLLRNIESSMERMPPWKSPPMERLSSLSTPKKEEREMEMSCMPKSLWCRCAP
ncbi:MAG: hypothetical protein K5787_16605 [Lentisphaeria bacterium]|nr:hypothetical protein [Lentisphaeria bacterium]